MPLSAIDRQHHRRLLHALVRRSREPSVLENLAAALLSRLLDVRVAIAKAGLQFGADAGTAGQCDRRLRIECKNYSGTSRLRKQPLLNEIDEALERDEALEAWILVATCRVPEQLVQSLSKKGERVGVPVVIIDWRDDDLAPLAALCAAYPDTVEHFCEDAAPHARALQAASAAALESLRRDLQSWSLGFEGIRADSHRFLEKIWTSPRDSNAAMGQNVAGGTEPGRIRRSKVHEAIDAWWSAPAAIDTPAAVVGLEGMGKTWAVMDWLVDSTPCQPIILTIPSSSILALRGVSAEAIKRFLAGRLHDLSGVRDPSHWMRRLSILLRRPLAEGPVLTIWLDGLNQESQAPWLPLLKALQAESFAGRVRVILTVRTHYYEQRLSRLRGLISSPTEIPVGPYSAEPGGEFEQILKLAGLSRDALQPDLVELAFNPRLFKLIIRLKDQLVDTRAITVHRLLWEYGRDSLGVRAGRSFSEQEWREYVREIARQHRDGVREFSGRRLSEMASRPDLAASEVYARLSDLVDGQFASRNALDEIQLKPSIVTHALGLALLDCLKRIGTDDRAQLEMEMIQWLDPIAGFDQRAEILRAAVSILVEQGVSRDAPIASVLVTSWLQTQNIPDAHREELGTLSPQLVEAFLDTVEDSDTRTHASARHWALTGLRALPRVDTSALTAIGTRACEWLHLLPGSLGKHEHQERNPLRVRELEPLLDTNARNLISVAGIELKLVRTDDDLAELVPSIIEGFPLSRIPSVLQMAAASFAIREYGEYWNAFQWLCELNANDPEETTAVLRELSQSCLAAHAPTDSHARLAKRVAALLLRLTGHEEDERAADTLDPNIRKVGDYGGRDWHGSYDGLPSRERGELERLLNDADRPAEDRVARSIPLWIDPDFEPPARIADDIRGGGLPVSGPTCLAFARGHAELLGRVIRKQLRSQDPRRRRRDEFQYAMFTERDILLAGAAEADVARRIRIHGEETSTRPSPAVERSLLAFEIWLLDPRAQIEVLMAAKTPLYGTELARLLKKPAGTDVDALIAHWGEKELEQQTRLAVLLSMTRPELSDAAWSWFTAFASRADLQTRSYVYRMLYMECASRLGDSLLNEGWRWSREEDLWIAHYCSGALIESGAQLPFARLVRRLAPWRALEAARRWGSRPADVRLAAEILHEIVMHESDAPLWPLRFDRSRPASAPLRPLREWEVPSALTSDWRFTRTGIEDNHESRRELDFAKQEVLTAHRAGHLLHGVDIDPADLRPVLKNAPDLLDQWLEGMEAASDAFRKRVAKAEPLYLALAEILLEEDPARGALLWRQLRQSRSSEYLSACGTDERLNILFRAHDTHAADLLRNEALELHECHSDATLLDIAVAATGYGRTDWLASVISRDSASPVTWKRKRAIALSGFLSGNHSSVGDAWSMAERSRWLEACARHWWHRFVEAKNVAHAYAAWALLERAVDPRAAIWMRLEALTSGDDPVLIASKQRYVQLHAWTIRSHMTGYRVHFEDTFLHRPVSVSIEPWRQYDDESGLQYEAEDEDEDQWSDDAEDQSSDDDDDDYEVASDNF